MLADECEDEIDIPTCHVVGSNDPWLNGALALYNMCTDDFATLFDREYSRRADGRFINIEGQMARDTLYPGMQSQSRSWLRLLVIPSKEGRVLSVRNRLSVSVLEGFQYFLLHLRVRFKHGPWTSEYFRAMDIFYILYTI